MKQLVKVCLVFLSLGAPASLWGLEPLSLAKLRQSRSGRCVLIHPWANWCTQCVAELPKILPLFEKWQGVQVLVIDVGNAFSQDLFSKKWDLFKKATIPTYLKPAKQALKPYLKAIDPGWEGDLPYSVLYSKGKKKAHWKGTLVFEKLAQEVASLCP